MMPILYRIGKDEYNAKVDLINKDLTKIAEDIPNLNIINKGIPMPQNPDLYIDKVHLSGMGIIELVKLLKADLNTYLGLKAYNLYAKTVDTSKYNKKNTFEQEKRFNNQFLGPQFSQPKHGKKNNTRNQGMLNKKFELLQFLFN